MHLRIRIYLDDLFELPVVIDELPSLKRDTLIGKCQLSRIDHDNALEIGCHRRHDILTTLLERPHHQSRFQNLIRLRNLLK